jgi:hypothetical protein
MNIVISVSILILGWILGFLSTELEQWISRRRSRKCFQEILILELKKIMPQLISRYFLLSSSLGKINKESLDWTIKMFEKFPEGAEKILENIKKIDFSKYDFSKTGLYLGYSSEKGKYIHKFVTPFLQLEYSGISLLPLKLQGPVIEIQKFINQINGEIEFSDFCFKKTYDVESPENYKILNQNTEDCYLNISKLCKRCAVFIYEKVLSVYEN